MDGLIFLRAQWDRVAAGAFIAGGGLLVVDAGQHARGAVYTGNSFSFLVSGGMVGLAAVAIGCTLLVSAGFHDEWRKLDRIEAALSPRGSGTRAEAPAGAARWLRAEADRAVGWALVVGAGIWLAAGSRLVAGALYTPEQVAYVISGGVAGIVVLLAGLALLLLADTRDEEHKLDLIDGLLPPVIPDDREADGAGPSRSLRPRSLWRGAPSGGLLLGALAVAAGWWRAADALRVDRALDGLLLAVIGVALVAAVLIGTTTRRRAALMRQARGVLRRVTPSRAMPVSNPGHRNGADSTYWTAEGLQRSHFAACPVLAGIDSDRRTLVPVGANLEPCLLCEAGE
jgi:hypothetical protein